MSTFEQNIARLIRIASPGVVVILGLCVSPGMAAAISGHGNVDRAVESGQCANEIGRQVAA